MILRSDDVRNFKNLIYRKWKCYYRENRLLSILLMLNLLSMLCYSY